MLGTTAVAAPLSEHKIVDGDTEGFIIISVDKPTALATVTSGLTDTPGAVADGISCGSGKEAVSAKDGSELSITSCVMGEL